jgi:hypothetical protein
MMADHPSEQVDRVAAALMNAATGQRTWTYTSLDQYRVLARAALDAATPPPTGCCEFHDPADLDDCHIRGLGGA